MGKTWKGLQFLGQERTKERQCSCLYVVLYDPKQKEINEQKISDIKLINFNA